ncbi:HigA family addiction module antitoxin [Parvularcula sp. IMCC14364]|uniref:HigA family addiction module antitoxin n=1 Tax=Parvularcula sp. IMCC14364 TaxID=3067902 RepID=UPI002740535D|nr:HigA family addiction module antitoxin [Parvularcula sp. IMCC14364]
MAKHTPLKIGMPPVHPGEFVQTEIIDEFGLTITAAAKHLDVRTATLSDLVNQKASLSPEMALRLELAFNLSADTLLRMQAIYDSRTIREKADQLNVHPYVQQA